MKSLLFLPLCLLLFSYREPATPYSEQCILLPSPGDKSGLFSVFTTVLGLVDFYDDKKCAGIEVDFGEEGLYFDPQKGPNWWNYYFEPVAFGNIDKDIQEVPNPTLMRRLTKTGFKGLVRRRAYQLIQKYIKPRPYIVQKVEAFAAAHFGSSNVIGIHYRGTDKKSEAARVPYQKVFTAVDQAIQNSRSRSDKIFVATDEKAFIEQMVNRYGDRVIYTLATRSVDGEAVHMAYKNNYKVGEEAVIDCLLLAKCDLLIRTASNLSTCVSFFNPFLPMIELNRLNVERSLREW